MLKITNGLIILIFILLLSNCAVQIQKIQILTDDLALFKLGQKFNAKSKKRKKELLGKLKYPILVYPKIYEKETV